MQQRRIKLSSSTAYLMLYQPSQQAGFICLEPQSHAANAHHMPGHPGLKLLGTKNSLTVEMAIRQQRN